MKYSIPEGYNKSSGIYKIINEINGKVYIGKTNNFYRRYHQYKYAYKTKNLDKINSYLLNSMIKYGCDNFTYEMVESCEIDKLSELELHWMTLFNSVDREHGYNLRLDSSTGMIVHPETSLKISERLKKEWSEGKRDDHSDKLKLSWNDRDKGEQGRLFSKYLTKYEYLIYLEYVIIVTYNELANMGYRGVLGKFSKKKTDEVIFKGVKIVRRKIQS